MKKKGVVEDDGAKGAHGAVVDSSVKHASGGAGAGRALDGVLSSCPIVVVSQKVATTIGKLYYTVPAHGHIYTV